MKLLKYTIIAVSMLLSVGTALGQTPTGSISGSVADASGAMIPGAKVTITDVDKGTSQTVFTDGAGRYRMGGLIPDHYEVLVRMEGFQTEIRKGIQLTVGMDAVINVALQVGQVAQTTTVTAAAPLVETVSGTVSSLVDDRAIRDLPLNGRSFDQLIALSSDAPQFRYRSQSANAGISSGNSSAFSVNGNRPGYNAFVMDGMEVVGAAASATIPGGALGINMGVDAIQEFAVLTSNYSAAFGKRSGGAINISTRSGTNELHGSGFEFLRNSNLDARNVFDVEKPSFKRNQFGAAFGGPIRKDATFFFGNYEGLRQPLGQTLIAVVPDDNARRGFLPNPSGSLINVGVVPSVQPYLNLFPAATPGTNFGDGTAKAINTATNRGTQDYFLARIDHRFNNKDAVFARYNFSQSQNSIPDASLTAITIIPGRDQALTVQETRTYAAFLNQARAGFVRSLLEQDGDVTVSAEPFFPGASSMGAISFATPSQAGIPPLNALGAGNKWGSHYVTNQLEAGDQASYYRGVHSVKFGANYQRIQHNDNNATTKLGEFTFTSLQNFLAGRAQRFRGPKMDSGGGDGSTSWRQNFFATFVQDDMKVFRNLTLNLGIRWEFLTAPTEKFGRKSNYEPQIVNGIPILPSDPVIGGPVFQTNFGTVAPRFGFAWDTFGNGKMAIRGGFGIFYNQIEKDATSNLLNAPFFTLLSVNNPNFPLGFSGGPGSAGTPTANVVDPHADAGTSLNWNFGIEREITSDMVWKVGYVGSHGNHLIRQTDLNIAIPQILPGGVIYYKPNSPRRNPRLADSRYRETDSGSAYNSFQTDVIGRPSHGWRYKFSYTFSKCIDASSGNSNSDTLNSSATSQNPFDIGAERGLCAFNIRHNAAANFTYDVPGKGFGGFVGKLLGGWQVGMILNASTGNPFEVIDGFSRSGDLQRTASDRPNLLPGKSNNPILGKIDKWFDPTVFVLPPEGFYGNVGRNTLTAPAFLNMDSSIVRQFSVTERLKLDFRGEFFNILNHPDFGIPNLNIFNPNGTYLGVAGAILPPTTNSARQIQFGLKLLF